MRRDEGSHLKGRQLLVGDDDGRHQVQVAVIVRQQLVDFSSWNVRVVASQDTSLVLQRQTLHMGTRLRSCASIVEMIAGYRV